MGGGPPRRGGGGGASGEASLKRRSKLCGPRPLHHGSLASRAPVVPLPRYRGGGWRERSGSRDALRARVLPSHSKKTKRTSLHQTSLTKRTEDLFFFRPVRGGRTPTDADPTAALARGARSAERARLSAFHRGSHLRELFHPKGSASGQASWDAVCTGVTRLHLSQSREAPPTPVIMPGDMMPKPPESGLQIHPRAPHPLHLTACLR